MREIKFRAWDKKEKRIFWSVQVNGNGTIRYHPEGDPMKYICGEKSDRFELMQYTGLKDCSNPPKEIYEGDLIKYNTHTKYIGVVEYFQGGFVINRFKNDNVPMILITDMFNAEVIGNIYENPELLKCSKDSWEEEYERKHFKHKDLI